MALSALRGIKKSSGLLNVNALAAIGAKEMSSSALAAEVAQEAGVSNAHILKNQHFDLPEPLMMGPVSE